jgi:hypothetical protein
LQCDHGGGAWRSVEQRQLTEYFARPQDVQYHLIATLRCENDLRKPFDHNVEMVSEIALMADDLPKSVGPAPTCSHRRRNALIAEYPKQRRRRERLGH